MNLGLLLPEGIVVDDIRTRITGHVLTLSAEF
jgi:hypothetical protein